jgi:hypothetical protein
MYFWLAENDGFPSQVWQMGRISGKRWKYHRDLGRHSGFHEDKEDAGARSEVDVEKRLFAHVW